MGYEINKNWVSNKCLWHGRDTSLAKDKNKDFSSTHFFLNSFTVNKILSIRLNYQMRTYRSLLSIVKVPTMGWGVGGGGIEEEEAEGTHGVC